MLGLFSPSQFWRLVNHRLIPIPGGKYGSIVEHCGRAVGRCEGCARSSAGKWQSIAMLRSSVNKFCRSGFGCGSMPDCALDILSPYN